MNRKRKTYIASMRGLMIVSTIITVALALFILIYVFAKGIPNINWELLSTKPSYSADRIGILPDILNTIYILLATLLIVIPLGVGAAIYLTEYAKNKKIVAIIEYAAEHYQVFLQSFMDLLVCSSFQITLVQVLLQVH